MIVAGSASPLLLASAGGYNLTRSLRFRSSASAYLNRTPASAGNRRTFTLSTWVKRGTLGVHNSLITAGNSSLIYQDNLAFDSSDRLQFTTYDGGSYGYALVTTQVFRDPSAWYHIVAVADTTQATDSNRLKLYVNGVQITAFSTANYPPQNYQTAYNSTNLQAIGKDAYNGSQFLDGYLAETIGVDGQALDPSSFGENNAQTGVWQPKKYAGTYGTNGFYLPFTDNSALTSGSNAGLGKDFSGNGNYWNTNNISITSGSTYDSMTDVPTLTSATASNFATANPLYIGGGGSVTYSNGNLTVNNSGDFRDIVSTIGATSGKFYAEVTPTAITTGSFLTFLIDSSGNYLAGYYSNGTKLGGSAYGASYAVNDVIGVAFDIGNTSVTFYKNNVSQGSQTFTNFGNPIFIATQISSGTRNFNFGQQPFSYTPPTGFVALNTFNLPTPTIGATASTQASKNFDVNTYTGNNTTNVITNSGGMQPDFVWIKNRNNDQSHTLVDVLRGTTKQLNSDTTNAEGTNSAGRGLQSFNSNGFTLGIESSATGGTNASGYTYVGWQWKANGSGSSNTAGSITSTVSANTSAGFSVVTYTGNGTNGATFGHGLGVAPSMMIIKTRSAVNSWVVYHQSLGNTKGIYLNLTGGADTNSSFWNNTSPSSTVATLGTDTICNQNGTTYVAYCFSEVAGYSKFGSYTGNGSSDGVFVYTGFRPKYVMYKRTDSTGGWNLLDTTRNPYNVVGEYLNANLSDAEANATILDIVSNGFKMRNTFSSANASGGTYIYMAFCESPFKYSLGR